VKPWRKSRSRKLWRVDFAIGPSVVRLLATFRYRRGRVYTVEDVLTGRRECVGAEYLKAIK